MKKLIVTIVTLTLLSWSAFGGGYQVRLQGQKQTGIGLIGTPFTYGASSLFYNPGALALVPEKFSFSVGASGIMGKVIFQKSATDYQARTDSPMGTPFYAYFSWKINDSFAIGFGAYTPFGNSLVWDDNWAGRYLIQNISLSAIYLQPTISYQVKDKFGIGAGLVYAIGNVEINKALYYNTNSDVSLKGSGSNIGFNVGVFYRPVEGVNIGIDYRSKINMKVEDGDANFNIPSSLATTIPAENKFSAELPLPANLDFGVSIDITEKWLIAFEINWVFWDVYDSLIFTFKESGDLLDSSNPRIYKNSVIPRIGAEFNLNEMFSFRAGAYYDPTPTNEQYFTPETVSLNTVGLTLGVSIVPVEGLSIDLSYLQLFGMEADKSYDPDNFSGTYKTASFIPGIGVSYNF